MADWCCCVVGYKLSLVEVVIKTFVTFSQNHIHRINGKTFDKDCVAVINHDKSDEGRKYAFEFFGDKFSFEYCEELFDMSSLKYFSRGFLEVN